MKAANAKRTKARRTQGGDLVDGRDTWCRGAAPVFAVAADLGVGEHNGDMHGRRNTAAARARHGGEAPGKHGCGTEAVIADELDGRPGQAQAV